MDIHGYNKVIKPIIENSHDSNLADLSRVFGGAQNNEESEATSEDRDLLGLMKNVSSLQLTPDKINEPFQPMEVWADGRRSSILSDFTPEELIFLCEVVDIVSHRLLQTRIYDLLWALNKPRNTAHAKAAIDGYITNNISVVIWKNGGSKEYERAYRLSKKINDSERVAQVEAKLKAAIDNDSLREISVDLAETIVSTGSLKGSTVELADRFRDIGLDDKRSGRYQQAIRMFGFAAFKYKKNKSNQNEAECLVETAGCYAVQARESFTSGDGRKLISAGLIETAIQAFRKVPKEYRDQYSVDIQIAELRQLLNEAGKYVIDSMGTISTPIENVEVTIQESKEYVSNKSCEYEALIYFSLLWDSPKYGAMKEAEKQNAQQNFFSSFFAPVHYAVDGRVVAKSSALNFDSTPEEIEILLNDRAINSFARDIQYLVRYLIIPALQQLSLEHSFSRLFIYELCSLSPIVPEQNLALIAHAIWLGFDFDFATAIFLVAPLMESIVRHQLKAAGATTTVLEPSGVEQEIGLTNLLELKEALDLFGEDHLFELKTVFSEALGLNLRNEVAHGLLSDSAAYSFGPVYAWWVFVRKIVRSTLQSPNANT